MVFECELAVKLYAKDVEVVTSSDRSPRQDQVAMGRAHNPGSTNDESLSFVRNQYRAPVIVPLPNPSKVPVNGGSNSRFVCWLANNCHGSVELSA